MLLVIHIIVALVSLIISASLLIKPSRNKVIASFGLIGLTLLSGTVLVLSNLSHLMSACLSGIAYISAVGFMAYKGRAKLANQIIKSK